MNNNNNSAKQRRSLKGALKTILLKCRRQTTDDASSTIGSGILRRDPSLPNLPNDSTTAFLLGLESVGYDDQHDTNDIPDRFDISSLATSAAMSSTRTLMPRASLSQFDLYHPPIQETRYLQRGRCDSISSSLVEGASYQASLITLRSFRSASTLKIQTSSQTLRSDSEISCSQFSFSEEVELNLDRTSSPNTTFYCPSPPRSHQSLSPRRSLLRKRASIGTLSSPTPLRQVSLRSLELESNNFSCPTPYDYRGRFARPLSVIEEVASYVDEPLTPRQSPCPRSPASRFSQRLVSPSPRPLEAPSRPASLARSGLGNSLLSIKHFSSFCALDTVTPGCPVTATSKDLRYIFEIGENFCLNNQGCGNVSIDMITGSDAAGNPVTHLVLFSPLIIPHSGRSRFMLACLVDITEFIHDTASLPELELLSEELADSDPPTPRCRSETSPKTAKYQLSAESLLGGCFADEPRTPVQKHDEDIWINLATEERKQYSQHSKSSVGSRTPVSAISTLSSVDDVLDDFMCKLQELHADFFLLAKSPLDDNYYEICNVSPRVYERRDYVNGHLSKTSVADMSKLSSQLVGEDAFDMDVRWGMDGVCKRLYCVPLFARSAVTWICFLVDPSLPLLW